ncbi:MAG: Rieske 2Fe-2S domain-containing protein, partial [Planctomycetota bacterium]
ALSHAYRAVNWNRHKKVYDLVLVGAVALYLVGFVGVSSAVWSGERAVSPMTMLIRALGSGGLVLLHVILCIGPLSRFFPSAAAPLLYNRRHLGVTMFVLGFLHAALATLWYHGFGATNPLVSIFTSNGNYGDWVGYPGAFPFEPLGFVALVILFLMAATSHDFWLKNLSPRVWKALHMLVYVAYGLLILHVALGAMQTRGSGATAVLLGAGVLVVGGLHAAAGWREWRRDRRAAAGDGPWVEVGGVDAIGEGCASVVRLRGRERVALVRHGGRVSAVSNVCAHQGGPLGEGAVVDGCLTCPWHGYQYTPENGQSPPPFTEKIPTYRVKIEGSRVYVNPEALPAGTSVEPAVVPGDDAPPPDVQEQPV